MDIVIPNATSIGVFSVAAILLLVTPGPAVLYIVARSVEQGRIAGLASVCGITTGTLVHVLAAALGLSALLASSALAFAVVKYAGAGYLVYIGMRRILSRTGTPARRAAVSFPPIAWMCLPHGVNTIARPTSAAITSTLSGSPISQKVSWRTNGIAQPYCRLDPTLLRWF